jgi:formylglycine-generating enzyme required for sulfatase activity
VDKYESSRITPLIGASNDATELAAALVKYAGFPAEQVIVLSSNQPDALKPKRNTIIAQLANLNGVVPADGLFLFAFSGHGVEADDKGYLLPADAVSAERNARFLEQTAVPVNYVKDEIRSYGVRQVVVLLDSCRNDPRAGKGAGDNLMAAPLAESFDFDRRNSEVEGFITFYATRSKMRAYEDPARRQGYFSYAFIEGLKGAAANERGEVTLANLIKYLEEKVPLYVKRDHGRNALQTPRTAVEGFRAPELVLAVTAAPRATATTFDPAALELALWQSADRANEISEFEEYLRQYPQGRYAVSARNRIARLRAPVSAPPTPAPNVRMSVTGVALNALAPFTTVKVDANGKITERRPNQESWGYVEDLGNGVKLEMVEVPAGEFLMGEDAAGAADYEKECSRWVNQNFNKDDCARWAKQATPQHRVKLNGFLMGRHEVTQRQWAAVMGGPPPNLASLGSEFKGDDLPVVNVSWEEAQEFIRKLNEKLKLSRSVYRLPSEAEWEYAARAGSRTPFAFGETIGPETANYWWDKPHRNAPEKKNLGHPVKVGSYPANAFGLFDMHGNVWEWCEDDWHDGYNGAPVDGRAWVDSPSRGSYRVSRGGGWSTNAVICRSAYRIYGSPGLRYGNLGFRLLRTLR